MLKDCTQLFQAYQFSISLKMNQWSSLKRFRDIPLNTRPKLNVHKMLKWRYGRQMSPLCTFSLGHASTGISFATSKKLIPVESSFYEINPFCGLTFGNFPVYWKIAKIYLLQIIFINTSLEIGKFNKSYKSTNLHHLKKKRRSTKSRSLIGKFMTVIKVDSWYPVKYVL